MENFSSSSPYLQAVALNMTVTESVFYLGFPKGETKVKNALRYFFQFISSWVRSPTLILQFGSNLSVRREKADRSRLNRAMDPMTSLRRIAFIKWWLELLISVG